MSSAAPPTLCTTRGDSVALGAGPNTRFRHALFSHRPIRHTLQVLSLSDCNSLTPQSFSKSDEQPGLSELETLVALDLTNTAIDGAGLRSVCPSVADLNLNGTDTDSAMVRAKFGLVLPCGLACRPSIPHATHAHQLSIRVLYLSGLMDW